MKKKPIFRLLFNCRKVKIIANDCQPNYVIAELVAPMKKDIRLLSLELLRVIGREEIERYLASLDKKDDQE